MIPEEQRCPTVIPGLRLSGVPSDLVAQGSRGGYVIHPVAGTSPTTFPAYPVEGPCRCCWKHLMRAVALLRCPRRASKAARRGDLEKGILAQ